MWPLVVERLVALLPTLDGWASVRVFDGPPVTSETPEAYCTVGFVVDEDASGGFEHELSRDGFFLFETGTVRCELVTQTGAVDLPSMRARGFALVDQITAAITADHTLGVLSPDGTATLAVDVQSEQTTAGAVQRLPFTLRYFTRTT